MNQDRVEEYFQRIYAPKMNIFNDVSADSQVNKVLLDAVINEMKGVKDAISRIPIISTGKLPDGRIIEHTMIGLNSEVAVISQPKIIQRNKPL